MVLDPALQAAAKTLKMVAPVEWRVFLDSLTAQEAHMARQLVASTPDRLQICQGMAQSVRDLNKALANVP